LERVEGVLCGEAPEVEEAALEWAKVLLEVAGEIGPRS